MFVHYPQPSNFLSAYMVCNVGTQNRLLHTWLLYVQTDVHSNIKEHSTV